MPFIHLPERGVNQYYCTNPRWYYSASLSTSPISGELDPNKPNIFFIHACGSSSVSQQRQFHDERLKTTFNMITMDAPFCGWTTGAQQSDGFITIEDAADNFLAALDALFGPGFRFSVLAEGFLGSNAASYMAYKRPHQVQSIAMASPGWFQETDEDIRLMAAWVEMCSVNKKGQGDKTGLLPTRALEMISDYYFAGNSRDVERVAIFGSAYQQRYGAGHSSHDLDGLMAWFSRKPIPLEVVASIRVPVIILAGGLDLKSPIAAAEAWREALTGVPGGASVQVLPSGPHLLLYAESGVANRIVYRFFLSALKLTPPATARPISAFS